MVVYLLTGVLAIAVVASGCGSDDEEADGVATTTEANTAPTTSETWSLVALGDSIPVAVPECGGCTSFVDLWAEDVTKETGQEVEVNNLAVPNAEATDVLKQVKGEDTTRSALKGADLVVVDVGINDSPWNRLDDPCDAAPNFPVVKWPKITDACIERVAAEYERTLDRILAQVEKLRASKPTTLRLANVYNAVIGNHVDPSWDSPAAVEPSIASNDLFAEIQCRLVEKHGGKCADVYRAFNGSDGSKPAKDLLASDYTHPSSKGHEVIGKLLTQTGTEPLP
jgi:lysophospholipase L1-like esterase